MNIKKFIPATTAELFAAFMVCLACLVLVLGSRLSRLSDSNSIHTDRPIHIYLHETMDLSELSTMLADSGVVESRNELVWAGRLLGWNRFNTGHYLIDGDYSYDVLLSRMARGIQDPVILTIIPGMNQARVVMTVASHFTFDSTTFANTLTDTTFLSEQGLEPNEWIGRMLPDSYSIYWTATPGAVIKRILNEFRAKVTQQYADRLKELDRTVDEIVTLASIIEWEGRHEEELATISGLYWNRLQRGMRLQADPTVNYAVGERRRLLYEDYRIDHPYNTYVIDGLPPGPITNPSLNSIKAALFPEEHDYLYMVATPEGYHLFSETFEEHKQKSEEWRKWLRKQYEIKRERESQQSSNDAS